MSIGVASALVIGLSAPYANADDLPSNTDNLVVLLAGSASGDTASLELVIQKAGELEVPVIEVNASGKRTGAETTSTGSSEASASTTTTKKSSASSTTTATSSEATEDPEESLSSEATEEETPSSKPAATSTKTSSAPSSTKSSNAPKAPTADSVFPDKNKNAKTPEKVAETIGKMQPTIEEVIAAAPAGTRFFLAGQEAGAGALGNVVTKIGNDALKNSSGELVNPSSIVGTTLISDPLRRGTSPIDDNSVVPAADKNLGGNTPGVGILGTRDSDFGKLQSSTVEICANGDATCANSGMLISLANALVDGDQGQALDAASKALGSIEDIMKMVQTLDQGTVTRLTATGATFGVAVASGNVPGALVSGGTVAADLFALAGPIVKIYESSDNLPQVNEALALIDPETEIGAKIWSRVPPEAATPEVKAVFSTIAKVGRSLNSIDKQRILDLGKTVATGVATMNPLIIPQVAMEIIQVMGQVIQAFLNPGVDLSKVTGGMNTLNVSQPSGTASSSSLSSLLSTSSSSSNSGPDMSDAGAATGLGAGENAGTGIKASSGVQGAPDYSTAELPGKSKTTATSFAPSWLESLAA